MLGAWEHAGKLIHRATAARKFDVLFLRELLVYYRRDAGAT
jgi:hypothetical protein